MKILVIDNSAVSVQEGRPLTNTFNGLFFEELIERGNIVSYFQFKSNTHNNINSFDLKAHGVTCYLVPRLKSKILSYILLFFKSFTIVRKVDFLYLYYPNTLKFIYFLCRLYKKPYGIYIRGMNGLNDKLSHAIYKNAYVVFTVSDFFTNSVKKYSKRGNVFTIRPMIPYCDTDIIKGRDYSTPAHFNILFLGRLDKDKGLVELLKAARHLHEKDYQFKLHIVGDGQFSDTVRQLVDDLSQASYVSIDGPVYDNHLKAEIYRRSDIYVLPTYHEGFPRTLYEAMIFGTPIITTFVGGIPALMVDGVNCKKIEAKSVDSLVKGLSYAMDNYHAMGCMALNASSLVGKIIDRNRLSHAQHLDLLLKNYEK